MGGKGYNRALLFTVRTEKGSLRLFCLTARARRGNVKTIQVVAQSFFGLVIVAALILVMVVAFRSVSGGSGAAPAATAGPVTGYPAPAQTQSGYPAPGATPVGVGSPYPTPSQAPTVAPTSVLPPLADSPDQFDPKTYGLPDTIAGYRVLGVVTPKNKACIMDGSNTLVLQTTDPTVQDYLKSFRQTDVMKAMSEMGLNTTGWNISVAGPGSTREQLIAGVQAWNKENEKYGCAYSEPPGIPAPTGQTP
jgi:hypothetical protein